MIIEKNPNRALGLNVVLFSQSLIGKIDTASERYDLKIQFFGKSPRDYAHWNRTTILDLGRASV